MVNKLFEFQSYIDTYRNNQFILADNFKLNFREFGNAVAHTAHRLIKNNISPGEKVAIIGEPNPRQIIQIFALFQISAVAVLINSKLPKDMIADELRKIDCGKYICEEILPGEFISCGTYHEDIITADTIPLKSIPLDRDATVMFTSGSTGTSKAVLHSFANHFYSALGSNENIEISRGDRWLQILPIHHVGGLAIVFRTFIAGGSLVIARYGRDMIKYIEHYNITHLSLVPTQLYRLLQSGLSIKNIRLLKTILLGGDKIPAFLVEHAVKLSLPVFTTYGLTEMSSQVSTSERIKAIQNLDLSGRVLRYRELKIADDGEILVRGKTLFKGYISQQGLRPERDSEGWFRTGDVGKLDISGNLIVLGRKDNMFITGGENVYPEEIETILVNIDGIDEAIVIGIREREYGSIPVAFIRRDTKQKISNETITEYLSTSLPKFKIPKMYFDWPDIKTDELKPNRRKFEILAKKHLSGD